MCFIGKECIGSEHHKLMRCSSGDSMSHVLSIYWNLFLEQDDFKTTRVFYRTKNQTHREAILKLLSSVLSSTLASFWPGPPGQGLETLACGPNQPPPVFVNWVLLARSHTHHWVLSVTAFAPQRQSWVAAAEMMWPAKPKLFTNWPFTENVCCPLFCGLPVCLVSVLRIVGLI